MGVEETESHKKGTRNLHQMDTKIGHILKYIELDETKIIITIWYKIVNFERKMKKSSRNKSLTAKE